jgi:hypothetical protein
MIKKKIIIFKGKLFFKETFETFPRCIITEFECRVDVQNHKFGWRRFQNPFFLINK